MIGELSHHAGHPVGIGASDLGANVRYLASLKNVTLTEGQFAFVRDLATERLSKLDVHHPIAQAGPRHVADLSARLIDQLINIAAASAVMQIVATVVEGDNDPDMATVAMRAREMVPQFTDGADYFVWPDPQVTFEKYFGSLPWAPITLTMEDGSVTTSHMRNKVLHRDPKDGPAFVRKGKFGERTAYWVDGKVHRDWRDGPAVVDTDIEGGNVVHQEYYQHDVLHRPSAEGPAVRQTCDGKLVSELFIENGKLHRDPLVGPALYIQSKDAVRVEYYWDGKLHRDPAVGPARHEMSEDGGELWEYAVNGTLHRDPKAGPAFYRTSAMGERIEYVVEGEWHRDHADGPALVDTNFEGKGLRIEEYNRHGEVHRPSSDGPALLHTDAAGRVVLEIYVENGEEHRDPNLGPSHFEIEAERKCIAYRIRGKNHRSSEAGPARTVTNLATGVVAEEEYSLNGEFHRENGPAWILRHQDGSLSCESWYLNGECHREGAPAHLSYREDGRLDAEVWYRHGEVDREPGEGAALSHWDEDGNVTRRQYRVGGEDVPHPDTVESSNA